MFQLLHITHHTIPRYCVLIQECAIFICMKNTFESSKPTLILRTLTHLLSTLSIRALICSQPGLNRLNRFRMTICSNARLKSAKFCYAIRNEFRIVIQHLSHSLCCGIFQCLTCNLESTIFGNFNPKYLFFLYMK